ncbi:MAG TPA: NUDIX hydrolase N-terminal domain-containing protein [Candidatus Onthomonas avicola]|nr:NUDIX hydrolase N-terminal domain-containing protein [Candidatus Onthomonas avicola]
MTPSEQLQQRWVSWAKELQSLAQAGLTYGADRFDLERYQRVREISAEILAHYTDLPLEQVKDLFCGESGYQTPKVDTRAALFQDDCVLLVQESNGLWSLPGGWCDEDQTVRSNAVKELWEEAGIRGRAVRLVAVQDRNRRNWPPYLQNIAKHLVLCELEGEMDDFHENLETVGRGFFPLDALPPLDTRRTTEEQIALCYRAAQAETWETLFD